MINEYTTLHGDCLIESDNIADGSVDLILTDLPYGTMNGFNGINWDFAIDPADVYAIANRVLRKNGKMVLFSQDPYTSQLITRAIPNIPFSYRMIWEKDSFANALLVNKAPAGYFEDILVFSKRHELSNNRPISGILRNYQEDSGIYWDSGELIEALVSSGIAKNSASAKVIAKHKLDWTYAQFEFLTKAQYELFSDLFKWEHSYEELKNINDDYVKVVESVFNLWEGGKHKSNILRYKKDYDGFHPTQKPVLLLEDLIKTFSNEGDLVVDLTMGSGSTGVAAANTGRMFIGIEKDEGYYEIARKRIEDAR